jgi:hypothetical protein
MALLSTAIASPKQLYSGSPTTTLTTIYTAPGASANVTSPSATAYIKEVIVCNTTAAAISATISIPGGYLLNGTLIPANDTKVLSLNTYLIAYGILQSSATAIGLYVTISGVEVQ